MPNRRIFTSHTSPFDDAVAAGAHIYSGNIVCLDAAGHAVPVTVATGLLARGMADDEIDNTDGAAGDKMIKSRPGAYLLDIKEGDEVTDADIGHLVYLTGPAEVGKTATGRSAAGWLLRIDQTGQAVVEIDGKVH